MRLLLILLLVKAIVLALIGGSSIGLAPDEAQYWTWSQELDWGYYSKPPGIAWQIWLTTQLFGNTVFGIRFGALVIGALLSIVVYLIVRAVGLGKRPAFWGGIVMAFSPLGVYLSLVATTDGGAILFLTLATLCVLRGPHYWAAGGCILIGALFKWTAFVFWPFVLIGCIFFKEMRRWQVLGGLSLSLLALLPSLYWNASHEWATFRHVGTAVGEVKGGNVVDFLGAQIGLLSPIFFLLLVISYFFLKRAHHWKLLFAGAFPCAVLIYGVLAFFKKMQPNWAAYLYPPGLVLIPWFAYEHLKRGRLWLQIGTTLSVFMIIVLFSTLWIQAPYKLNPFRQQVGWENLKPALLNAGYHPDQDFLFADKYQNASLLSFYGPEQKRAYFFNLSGNRKNQFSYWPSMEQKEIGQSGYFVVIENTKESSLEWYKHHYRMCLKPYFTSVHYQGAYPLYAVSGTPVKYALLFKGVHYLGGSPPDPNKF